MLTSGTTGPPKRVRISDGQFDAALATSVPEPPSVSARLLIDNNAGRPESRITTCVTRPRWTRWSKTLS